jgi:hypothetical protein
VSGASIRDPDIAGANSMKTRDFGLVLLVCLIWAANQIMSRLVVTNLGVPPIFYSLVRSIAIAALLLPMLRPFPRSGLAFPSSDQSQFSCIVMGIDEGRSETFIQGTRQCFYAMSWELVKINGDFPLIIFAKCHEY